MKGRGVQAFLLSCVFWLIPGILAGVVTAVCFSFREYDYTVRLTEAALEGSSIPEGLKYAAGRADGPDQGSSQGKQVMPESGGGAVKTDADAADADAYLRKYGHRRLTRFPDHLPYALAAGIVLFEIAGGIVFLVRERKEMRFRTRI